MKFEVYQDSEGKWWWRLVGTAGRVLAISGEAYALKKDCAAAIAVVKSSQFAAVVEAKP